jgi:ankyrin repeat protein
MHQIDEVIHHGSEVALMRDLYRATVLSAVPASDSVTSVVHAAATGYWADVRSLLAAGGDVAGTQEHDFNRTALHYAASAAPLDVVKLLVERGADLAAKDAQFDATPLGWAEYFGRDDIAEYLRAR